MVMKNIQRQHSNISLAKLEQCTHKFIKQITNYPEPINSRPPEEEGI
jgi:hypothetical protein